MKNSNPLARVFAYLQLFLHVKFRRLATILARVLVAFSFTVYSCLSPASTGLCEASLIDRSSLSSAQLEAFAVHVMGEIKEQKERGVHTVLGWMRSIKESEASHPLNPLEHVTLVFILKSGIFEAYPDARVVKVLRESIRISYRHLSGKSIAEGEEFTPLPAGKLAEGSLAATVFHDAIMPPTLQSQVRQTVGHFSFFNTLSVLASAVALCFEPSAYALAGMLVGLTEASINEYMVHIGVGHAPKEVAKSFRKLGPVGEFMEQVTLAHKLHHSVVSAGFGAAYLSPEQKELAEKVLLKLAKALVLERIKDLNPDLDDNFIRSMPEYTKKVDAIVEATRKGNYGVDGTTRGALSMIASASPFLVLNYMFYTFTGSQSFLYAADFTMVAMILQSLYSHKYLHLSPEDEARSNLNRFQLYYVNKTWLGQLARRLHFTHHELPFSPERTRNGVIMAGSVYDRLKGNIEMPRVQDLIKMFQEGYLTPED